MYMCVCTYVCISYQIYNLHMTKRSNDVQYILLLTINYDFIGKIGLETPLCNLLAFIFIIWSFSRFRVHLIWARENQIIVNNIIAAKNIAIKKGLDSLECVHIRTCYWITRCILFCSPTCNITLRRQDGDSFIGIDFI